MLQLSTLLAVLGASVALSSSGGAYATKPKFTYQAPSNDFPGVQSKNRNGPTNPDHPSLHTPINQRSEARLASINSIDDWCTFGPRALHNTKTLGEIEQTTVAYCTQPRNNARVIPDGTITRASFTRTPLYVQVYAQGDFTKIHMAPGDEGGELDPHGATNMGNPVGGNVTSNVVDGKTDVFYQEWMNYVSATDMCFRVCVAGSADATPEQVCQHTLDEMGCQWVMPQADPTYDFETCEADAAYPPGLYPKHNDQTTSTFQQYFTGIYTGAGGSVIGYTNGAATQHTPAEAYSIPSSSQCHSHTSIQNQIPNASLEVAGHGKHQSTNNGGRAHTTATAAVPSHKSKHHHHSEHPTSSEHQHHHPSASHHSKHHSQHHTGEHPHHYQSVHCTRSTQSRT